MEIELKHRAILLEALEDLMYKISLQLVELKGKEMNRERKELTKKQIEIEALQHQITIAER